MISNLQVDVPTLCIQDSELVHFDVSVMYRRPDTALAALGDPVVLAAGLAGVQGAY